MTHQALALAFRAQHQADEAETRTISALLNCYCREVAMPAGELDIDSPFGQNAWPLALKHSVQREGCHILLIHLPHSACRLLVAVTRPSVTLNFDYRSQPYGGGFGQPWQPLGWRALAGLLLGELSARYGQSFNHELLQQIENSLQVMGAFLDRPPSGSELGLGVAAYLRSEQALIFGHAYHPTPKSRQGIALDAIRRYSPELGAAFQLHYFAVRRTDIHQCSHLEQSAEQLLAAELPALPPPEGYIAVPVHPWQAGYIRGLAPVRKALDSGRLLDLGPAGELWYPTASVRTLYQPERNHFLKCSLHVRLTNCVRKNAWYELESAVSLSQLLTTRCQALYQRFPSLSLMPEPAFLTVDFNEEDEALRRDLQEAFGLILRRKPQWRPTETPLLAAALFSAGRDGMAPVQQYVARLALARRLGRREAARQWFAAYLEHLIEPVLYALCRLGVVFEPHLQNVVVGIEQDLPARIHLRDLEGTKLIPEHWPEARLSGWSKRARESVWYPWAKGWQRIGYCLLINNLTQAVFHLAPTDAELEALLWRELVHTLERYQQRHGNERSGNLIASLLDGAPWPNKTNLLNRVLKRADRASEYVPLPSPLKDL